MAKGQLKTALATLFAVAVAVESHASSMTLQGTLRVHNPLPSVKVPENALAFVKPYNLTVDSKVDGCTLTSDVAMAQSGSTAERLFCLLEWENTDPGLKQTDLAVTGYAQIPGQTQHRYTISYFSGSNRQKVLITEGSYTNNLETPVPPKIVNANTRWGTAEWKDGFEPTNHDSHSSLRRLRVFVEPRNYHQRVDFDGKAEGENGYCLIEEGAESCEIVTNISLGGEVQGSQKQLVSGNSMNQHYDPTLYSKLLSLQWDYRPPVIESVVFNATGNRGTVAHELDGEIVQIPENEGIVVLSSPHFDGNATGWWVPAGVNLSLEPDGDFTSVETSKVVDGHTLFSGRTIDHDDTYKINTHGSAEIVGNKIMYRVNLRTLPDGGYQVDATAQDRYSNRNHGDLGEQFLSRSELEIGIFNNYVKMKEGGSYYFAEHLIAASFNNFKNGSKISRVSIDGQTMQMVAGEDDSVQYLSSNGLVLQPDSRYQMTVEAEDLSGEVYEYTQSVSFVPANFTLDGVMAPTYARLTENRYSVKQQRGEACRMFASVELAQGFASRNRLGCTMDWPQVPVGMYVDDRAQGRELLGTIDSVGNEFVTYRVHYHDGEGNTVTATNTTQMVEALQPSMPTVKVLGNEFLENGLIIADIRGGRFGNAEVLSVPATVELESIGGEGEADYYLWRERRSRTNPGAPQKGNARLYVEPGELWSKRDITLTANYQLIPDEKVTETAQVLFVPSKSIRSHMSLDDSFLLTSDQLAIGGRVGIYNRRERSYDYDAKTFGEWNLTLENRISRNEHEVIAGPIRYDGSEEEVIFRVDGADWLGKTSMCIRADLVSPQPGFERSLRSNCLRVAVFKGESIDGSIRGSRLTGRAPLSLVTRYQTATREDRDSAGKIIWQLSKANEDNWQNYDVDERRQEQASFTFDEAGEWKVRAKVYNKFSGAESITDELHIIAYNRPKLAIEGPKDAYINEANVSVELWDELTEALADGDIMWSMDDGRTWEPGGTVKPIDTSVAKNHRIRAKMRYDGTQSTIRDGWDETRFYLKVQPPRKPRVYVRDAPKDIEVGEMLTIQGEVSQDRLGTESEWITPDGQIIPGELLNVPVNQGSLSSNFENRTYQLRAWVKGYKSQTQTSKFVRVRIWQYSMPQPEMRLRTRVKYAPAFIDADIRNPRIFAPTVSYEKDINFDPQFGELLGSDANGKFSLKLYEPGIYPITAILRDNRGNETTFMDFFEVFEPIPMTVKANVRSYSNREMKAPLSVYLYAERRLPHNQDNVTSIQWYLNGALLNEDNPEAIFWSVEDLSAGEHEIKLVAESEFGQRAENSFSVTVIPNQPPQCTMDVSQDTAALNFRANCHDPDGQVRKHEWYINDVYVGGSDRLRYFKNPHLKNVNSVEVRLVAYDDSFDSVEISRMVIVHH